MQLRYKIFGREFIIRLRKYKSLWKFPHRKTMSYRVDIGRLVCYLYDQNSFHNLNRIIDNKGKTSVA